MPAPLTPPTPAVPCELLTKAQVAQAVKLGVRTITRLVAAGTFPQPVRIVRRRPRWRPEDITAFLARRQQGSRKGGPR
jgi:predicted DNA-binding transcriptional regulator AlpA